MRLSSLAVPLAFTLAGCVPGDDGKETGGVDTADTGDSGGVDTGTPDTAPPDRGTGGVNGTVRVQLYQTDADGEISDLSWEAYGGAFPFGAIYVAAYTIDEETGAQTYHAEQVIAAPSIEGDPYTLAVDLDDAEAVYLYAALDWWPDGVIGTSEPVGIYGDLVAVIEGSAVDDVDIVINAPLHPTGGGGGSAVSIEGNVTIEGDYAAGVARVMLYDSAGNGPSYVTTVQPTVTEAGATAPYALAVGANYGEGRLIGAWDDDANGLIEPTDRWGAYVVGGENGNPITIGAVNLAAHDVTIPFGIAPALTPFVRLEGALNYADGYDTLPAGAVVYVTALKSRRNEGEFSVDDLQNGYDWASFTGAD
ncbi:MAG: hypothetical protein ACK4YP_21950, partial [Myxococcota bacterium]